MRPPWLRRYAYRLKNRMRSSGRLSEYLCQEYRDAALPEGVRVMTELFRLDRVGDPAHTARILTLEYLINRFEGRIRVDFHHSSSPDHRICAA